jgi:hypothetical protein
MDCFMLCACKCICVELGINVLIHIPAECNLIASICVPSADVTYAYQILQENLKRKGHFQGLGEREHNLDCQACP